MQERTGADGLNPPLTVDLYGSVSMARIPRRREPRVAMPPSRSTSSCLAGRTLVLAVGTALAAILPALSQESGLRGEVSEAEVNRSLIGASTTPSQPQDAVQTGSTPAYRPSSPGAVPATDAETGATTSLFGPSAAASDDTFAPLDPAPAPSVRSRRETVAATAPPAEPVAEELELTFGREQRLDSLDEERNARAQAENVRNASVDGLEPVEDPNPFSPLGLRLGTFIVTPTLDTGITWTSNANYSPTPRSAFLSESTLRFTAASDWARHSALINAYGTYRKTISGEEIEEPSGGIDAALNLDLSEGLRAIASLGYQLRPEPPDSPVELPPTDSRPLRHTLEGRAGLEKDIGKLRFSLFGDVERQSYDDIDLTTGVTQSQEERNSTLVAATIRTGYAISPALTPFAELQYGRRIYDLEQDTAGYRRSSDRLAARAGVEVDLGEKLQGEFAAGWINEDFDDARLAAISGLSAAADLTWSPYRGTTVNLNAETTVEGTTTAGESGSLLHSGTLTLARQLRADLSGDLALGAAYRDYSGTSDYDLTLSGQSALTWWMNRHAGIVGRYRYETLTSSLPDRDTETHSVYLGLRLQR